MFTNEQAMETKMVFFCFCFSFSLQNIEFSVSSEVRYFYSEKIFQP